jgi:hypothetical protein
MSTNSWATRDISLVAVAAAAVVVAESLAIQKIEKM